MKIPTAAKFLISLALPLLVGGIAGFATAQSVSTWYETLNAPSFRPPNWVFGPVWSTLYLLLGISLFLVWKQEKTEERDQALRLFSLQLLLNFAWSFLFFYFHWLGIAFVEILLLWGSILAMIMAFRKVKPVAAYMNIPYLLWVSFASLLNGAYFWLN